MSTGTRRRASQRAPRGSVDGSIAATSGLTIVGERLDPVRFPPVLEPSGRLAPLSDDHRAIVRLTYDYAFHNDTFDVDALLECFADGATLDLRPAGLGLHDGKAAIRDFFDREKRAVSHVMHHTSNHRIDLDGDGDGATGTAYYIAVAVMRAGGERTEAHGYYDDRYVRTAAGWRFRSRTAMPLIPWTPLRPAGAS